LVWLVLFGLVWFDCFGLVCFDWLFGLVGWLILVGFLVGRVCDIVG